MEGKALELYPWLVKVAENYAMSPHRCLNLLEEALFDLEKAIDDFHNDKINQERLNHIVRDTSVAMLFDDIRDSLNEFNEVNIPQVQRVILSLKKQLYNF